MHYDLLGSGLGGLFVAWLVGRTLLRRRNGANDWMPPELRASRLAYAEQLFRSVGPVSVSARVDRAYRDQAGVVTLVELKTRKADRSTCRTSSSFRPSVTRFNRRPGSGSPSTATFW